MTQGQSTARPKPAAVLAGRRIPASADRPRRGKGCDLLGKRLRQFLAAFFLTLLVISTAAGFVAVDTAAEETGFGGLIDSFSIEKSGELTYLITTREGLHLLNLTPLNAAEQLRRDYEVFTTPRAVRLGGKCYALFKKQLARYREWRLEQDFQRAAGQP